MPITAEQCRAARAMLGWSQDQLAAASKVAKATIANFEANKRSPYERTLLDIQEALEEAGVAFLGSGEMVDGGVGVRLRKSKAIETEDTDSAEMIQYPEFLEGDGGPGSGG